jgi:hypothetical protein
MSEQQTVNKLLETVAKLANRWQLSRDEKERAGVIAWWFWRNRTQDFPLGVWARWACRQARDGRDLPGVRSKNPKDVMNRSNLQRPWQGAGMGSVADKTPPPDVLVMHRERWERLLNSANAQQREVARLAIEGLSNLEIAERLHVTPGRVSQIKRAIADRWYGDD